MITSTHRHRTDPSLVAVHPRGRRRSQVRREVAILSADEMVGKISILHRWNTVIHMSTPSRWFTDTEEGHSQWYIERFRTMAAEGADLDGEARLVDAMVRRGSRILDAGCGQGRVGAALFARGHEVVGVDADPELLAAAIEDYPGPFWLVSDLADLDLASFGEEALFDAAVLAGNVMAFVAVGTEVQVLTNIFNHLVPDGFAIVGFHTDRYDIDEFDQHLDASGFVLEHRFATWDVRPWKHEADFAVSVLRKPASR